MNKRLIAELTPNARDASPLYLRLARKLTDAVQRGRFQPNEALPSERMMSEYLGVSRVTARNAIAQLVEQGLIARRHGSGNYIVPHLQQTLSRLTSFSENLALRGYTPSSRWLTRALSHATPKEQETLGLKPRKGHPVMVARLERLRLADDVPMAYEATVMPQTILPDPTVIVDSLYAHLDAIGKAPVQAVQHIRAANCPAWLAGLFDVAPDYAVLDIVRIGRLDSGQVIEFTHSYVRSDYYDFIAEMKRE